MRTHLSSAAKLALVVVTAINFLSGCFGKAIQAGDEKQAMDTSKINTTLPPHFPVPIVNNAKIINVIDMPTATPGVKGYSVSLECTDDVEKVNRYYAYTLSQAGWSARQMTMPGLTDVKTLFGTKGPDQITVTVMNSNGKANVTIMVQPIPGVDRTPPPAQ